jgi:hypothetical protein
MFPDLSLMEPEQRAWFEKSSANAMCECTYLSLFCMVSMKLVSFCILIRSLVLASELCDALTRDNFIRLYFDIFILYGLYEMMAEERALDTKKHGSQRDTVKANEAEANTKIKANVGMLLVIQAYSGQCQFPAFQHSGHHRLAPLPQDWSPLKSQGLLWYIGRPLSHQAHRALSSTSNTSRCALPRSRDLHH